MAKIVGKPIGPIGYGMMNLTWRQTPIPDDQAFATMKAALAKGCNFWNAAIFYGKPEANSLQLLNRYFTRYPEDAEKVVLSVKGADIPGTLKFVGTKSNISRSIEECLKLLDGKKFLDVFAMARQDPGTPIEESVAAMAEYIRRKQIGGIGLSEVTADQIRAHAALHPVAAVEVECSLASPDILENGVAATCAELDIPIVAYSPLGRGLLTSSINTLNDLDAGDIRRRMPRFQPENIGQNARLGSELQKIADAKGCTSAQIAIAWSSSLSKKPKMPTIIPIPGSTTQQRATENAVLVELEESELVKIEDIRMNNVPAGQR